jgi:tetratricopeptide (TPR) repeat protein
MSEPIACPDCGHRNPAGSTICEQCHFPLGESPPAAPKPAPESAPESRARPGGAGKAPGGPAAIPMVRPIRPRRPRPQANVAVSLWLGVGTFLALLLVLIAIQGYHQNNAQPVEGSNSEQQKSADEARAALEKDSTDIRARVALADILFDTGNWSEAIVHYRSAVRHDSTLVSAIVDQGVCYYNLSQSEVAERLFRLALAREPHQPFALYNLGIVYEQRGSADKALEFFHQALESSPPETMKPALLEAMQRASKAAGKQAPPLNNPR